MIASNSFLTFDIDKRDVKFRIEEDTEKAMK
jgi:hypothetical protein